LTRSSIHMATRNASTRLLDLSPHDQLPSLDFIALAENRERESHLPTDSSHYEDSGPGSMNTGGGRKF
jgi:hypothetical protein